MAKVKWNRSDEGYAVSKCARFDINPLFIGCCTPQAYELLDNETNKRYMSDTQRDCKANAQDILDGKIGVAS